jgi:hypothetical protein
MSLKYAKTYLKEITPIWDNEAPNFQLCLFFILYTATTISFTYTKVSNPL